MALRFTYQPSKTGEEQGGGGLRFTYDGFDPPSARKISPLDQKLLKSFQSLPESNRKSTLDRLMASANAGDAESKRKIALLQPTAKANIPKEADYTDKGWDSHLYRARKDFLNFTGDQLASVIDMVSGSTGQTAGEEVTMNGRIPVVTRSGRTNEINDVALDAMRARIGFAGARTIPGLKPPVELLKAGGVGAATGGVSDALGVFNSGNTANKTPKQLIQEAGTAAVIGAGTGLAFGAGEKGLQFVLRALKGQPVSVTTSRPAEKTAISKLIDAEGEKPDPGQVLAWKTAIQDGKPIDPILVRPDSQGRLKVEAGKHRLQAYKELGVKEVPTEMKAVAQDVGTDILPRESRKGEVNLNPSSRVKQYEESLQPAIKNLEKDPAYLESLKERGGGVVISNKETYAKAKAAGPMLEEELINAKAGGAVDAVQVVRAKATLNAVGKEFTDFWQSNKDKWNDQTFKEEFQRRIEHMGKLEAGYHVISAEPGRATQIQASFIDKATQRAEKLRKLATETKGKNKEAIIDREMKKFDKELEAEATKAGFNLETAKSIVKMIEEYATAAKLTSPLTHAVNFASTPFTMGIRAAENIVSTFIGAAQGRTGLGQVSKTFGTFAGWRKALVQFGNDLKQAVDPRAKDLEPDGTKMENQAAIPGKTGKAIRTPFNVLQAADNFWKNVLRDSELNQRAYENAWQEGFRGKELAGRIAELVQSPTEEMLERASKVAKEFTFTSDPGPIMKDISKLVNDIPFGRLLVPFISTPTNVMKFQAQRHPIGVFAPRNIDALMKGSNLERREAIARLTVGTGLAVAGVMAAFGAKDNITGPAPSDPGEKDLFYGQNKKPYAIKIGDRWVQYNRFQPIGMYLTQAVGVRDMMTEIQQKAKKKGQPLDEKDLAPLFMSLVNSTAAGLSDMPFVQGMSSLHEWLGDPTERTWEKLAGGTLSGLIPNVGRDIASGMDPVARKPEGLQDNLKQMIPTQKEKTLPRVDLFGEVQTNRFNSGSDTASRAADFAERGFLKITGKEKSNALATALKEVADQTGYYPQPITKQNKVNGKTLEPRDLLKYQALAGTKFRSKLEQALADSDFQDLNSQQKRDTIEQMVTDSRTQARKELGERGEAAFVEEEKSKKERVKRY